MILKAINGLPIAIVYQNFYHLTYRQSMFAQKTILPFHTGKIEQNIMTRADPTKKNVYPPRDSTFQSQIPLDYQNRLFGSTIKALNYPIEF